jgi:hypothetical protein
MTGFPQEWSTDRGTLTCEEASRSVVLFRLKGHLDVSFARAIKKTVEVVLASGARPHLFFDADEATGLDSQFRMQLTPWHKEVQPRVSSQNVLVRSKILAMAISVSNMAIGHVIKPYNRRQEFEAAIAAAKK